LFNYYTIHSEPDVTINFGHCDEYGNTDHLPRSKEFYAERRIEIWVAIQFDPSLWKGQTKTDGDILLGRLIPN